MVVVVLVQGGDRELRIIRGRGDEPVHATVFAEGVVGVDVHAEHRECVGAIVSFLGWNGWNRWNEKRWEVGDLAGGAKRREAGDATNEGGRCGAKRWGEF